MVTRVTVGVTASLLLCLLLLSIWFDYYIHFLNHFVQNIYEIVKVELSLPSYDYRCKIDHGDSYNPIASSSKVNLNRYAKLRLSIIDDSFSSFDLDSTTPKRSTNYYRCLPNILFIGASKCGTTSLTDYLDSHEEVFFVNRHVFRHDTHREVHRFDRRDYAWTQFGSLGLAQEWASSPLLKTPQQPLIHYTPHYLYAPTVPLEVSRFYPRSQEMRFVVVLRDPVDRAVSAYWFQQSHLFTASGRDKGSWADFEAQVDGDIIKRNDFEECMRKFNSFNQSALTEYTALRECFGSELRSRTLGQRHVDKGVYVDQLDRWMRVFPSDNFFIFTLEQWNIDPHHIFQQLLLFIGVSERGAGIFESSNNTHANHNRSRRSIVLEMMKDTVRSIKHQWDTIRRNTSIVSPNIESKFEYTDSRNHTQLIDFSHQRLVRPNRLSQEPMPESLKHKLIKFYTPHNTRLVELLTDVVRKGK